MNGAEYIVRKLIEHGVTDAFGIPGGVILPLIYEMASSEGAIKPHLCYHEQAAGFAACGYAHKKADLGVAYATRGPGIMNMMTAMAEAYQEFLPVLFLTAHGSKMQNGTRVPNNQELEVVSCAAPITKLAMEVNSVEELPAAVELAVRTACVPKSGPVLLDFSAAVLSQEIPQSEFHLDPVDCHRKDTEILDEVYQALGGAERPVLLIGDGIRQSHGQNALKHFMAAAKIPVLSSRGAQDLAAESSYYSGYVGSHGIRYSNFILSKADVILVAGNRLSFPSKSQSFVPIFQKSKLFWIDVDEAEFVKELPNLKGVPMDVVTALEALSEKNYIEKSEWIAVCREIKRQLSSFDKPEPVMLLEMFLTVQAGEPTTYVCDVGNNEFWFSRAFEAVHPKGDVLFSKSFGTLGSALARAIGVHYATGQRVVCVTGDQGFQFNLQELQYIRQWNLPIHIVLLNNSSSGMIRDRERSTQKQWLLHVYYENGYSAEHLSEVVQAYGIPCAFSIEEYCRSADNEEPFFLELNFSREVVLEPYLPKGVPCQDLHPRIERVVYDYLNAL